MWLLPLKTPGDDGDVMMIVRTVLWVSILHWLPASSIITATLQHTINICKS